MTAEQIAVNASAAAEIAGLDPKGYIVARCHEILHNIDTLDVDRDAQFAALAATARAVRLVWEQEDADEPADEEIAVAAAEAITGNADLQEVDHTALPEPIDDRYAECSKHAIAYDPDVAPCPQCCVPPEAQPEYDSPLMRAQRYLFDKMWAK